jgi:predicted nucleotidyltransferase
VKNLILFGKIELPIKLETVTYEEYILDEVKYSRDQAEMIAKTKALTLAKEKIPKDSEILNCEYHVFEEENEVIVRATVMCIESVGIKEVIELNVM